MSEEKPEFYNVDIYFKNKTTRCIDCIEDFLIDNRIRVFITSLGYRVEVPLINVNSITYYPERKHFLKPQEQQNGKT